MKHIVALSGGKDSTALALRLSEVEPRDYTYLCTPTGDELPPMAAHWQKLENILDAPIIRVKHPLPKYRDLKSVCHAEKALPSWRMRFCTRILKIEAAEAFYAESGSYTAFIGLRADEESRTGNIENDDSERHPLKEWGWGLNEVQSYLIYKNITIPPRTDCARCFYQRKGEWWNLWKDYGEIYDDAEQQEAEFNHTFLDPGKWNHTFPHALKDMRKKFEGGYIPRKADMYHPLFPDTQNQKCRVCSM